MKYYYQNLLKLLIFPFSLIKSNQEMMKIDENEKMKLNSWISCPKLGVSENTNGTDARIPFILGGYLGAKYGN